MTCLCGHPAADHQQIEDAQGLDLGECDLCACVYFADDGTEAMFEVGT